MPIARRDVHCTEYASLAKTKGIKGVINPRQRVSVLLSDAVEASIIDAKTPRSIFLLSHESTLVAQRYLLYLLRYWSLVQFPVAAKLSQKKNCVNYQLDNLLIKGVVGSTIKTRQPQNVGDDGLESSTIKRVTCGPLESYTGGQKLQNYHWATGVLFF